MKTEVSNLAPTEQNVGDIVSGVILLRGDGTWNTFDAMENTDKLLTLQGMVAGLFQLANTEVSDDELQNYSQEILSQINCNEEDFCNE